MSALLFGSVASVAVFLGLPFGRIRQSPQTRKRFVQSAALGILHFLLLDLFGHARELPLEVLSAAVNGTATLASVLALLGIFAGGLLVGWLVGVAIHQQWHRMRVGTSSVIVPERERVLRLSILIAVGIGFYNLLQGMGIGQAGRFTVHTAISLREASGLLLIGFLLQSITKSFAIVSPLIGNGTLISWRYLLMLGAVAGLPTILGTVLGASVWAPHLFVGLFTIAVGIMLFVLREYLQGEQILGGSSSVIWGGLTGFVVAVVATVALEINHYSLPELMSSYWL